MATTVPPEANSSGAGSAGFGWHRSAPRPVRHAYSEGDIAHGWAAWTEHLASREYPVAVEKLLPGRHPFLWAVPDEAEAKGTLDLLARLDRFGSKRLAESDAAETVADWLAEAPAAVPDVCWAVEAVAWCRRMPRLAAKLPGDDWWTLLDRLLGTVAMTGQFELEQHPLAHQLLAGELALTLGYLFPEIAACRKAGRKGRRALSDGLVELTDGRGFLHGKHVDLLRPLLATWTRCRAIGREVPKGSWNAKAENEYEWLVRHALRLSRADGSHVLSSGPSGGRSDELIETVLELAGNKDDRLIAALALPGGKKKAAKAERQKLPKASYHSPWGETGVLRAGWARGDSRLLAVYAGNKVRLELESAKSVLISGEWELDVRRNGQRLTPTSEWSEVCWVSDKDIDYLELEIELDGGLTVGRHMALAREDDFLFLADAVLAGEPGQLEYQGRLPLAGGVSLEMAKDTREGYLEGKRRAASVLPLALPEWRVDPRVGTLEAAGGAIELSQSSEGRALFAPLFVDLRSRRMGRPLTWRQLTVAESLQIQPPDVAVGYRAQIGKQQWLVYRSLAAKGNRTLLGHNLSTDLLIARFRRDGEVETLVEIE